VVRYNNGSRWSVSHLLIQFLRSLMVSIAATICLTVLAHGLILFSAWAASAQTAGEINPHFTAHVFKPGTIVNGHNRQPTQAEIDERTLELWASKVSAGSCR
jgi:hypothetical protein